MSTNDRGASGAGVVVGTGALTLFILFIIDIILVEVLGVLIILALVGYGLVVYIPRISSEYTSMSKDDELEWRYRLEVIRNRSILVAIPATVAMSVWFYHITQAYNAGHAGAPYVITTIFFIFGCFIAPFAGWAAAKDPDPESKAYAYPLILLAAASWIAALIGSL